MSAPDLSILDARPGSAAPRPYDFPERDDERFLRHSLTRWKDGEPELDTKEVRVTKWQPEVRSY